MKEYNFEEEKVVYTCKACGYSYKEDDIHVEEFIKFRVTAKREHGFIECLEEKRIYACPICGTLFIEV